MKGLTTTEVRLAVTALGGRDAASGVPGPYLVLDLGRGRDPHQTRCRRCRVVRLLVVGWLCWSW